MSRTSARVTSGLLSAVLLVSAGLMGVATAAFADEQGGEEEEAEVDTGLVVIPYLEPVEIAPAEGWRVDCAGVGELEGIEMTCVDGKVTLTADTYDSAWGEHVLTVPLRAGSAEADVAYRVRQGPPTAPVLAASVIDAPLEVGRQTLVPLSLLGVECTLCAEDASLAVVETTPGLVAGVSGTHLALRGSIPGEGIVTVEITDDTGQAVSTEITVFVTPASASAVGGPTALHVTVASAEGLSLADLAWGSDLTFSCPIDPVVAVTCDPDGGIAITEPEPGAAESTEESAQKLPVQFSFRVVDADGRQSIGSVTIDPDAEASADGAPVPVRWAETADLGIAVAIPPDEDEDGGDEASVLSELDRILQEVPTP